MLFQKRSYLCAALNKSDMDSKSYNIYFQKRVLTICNEGSVSPTKNPNAVICCAQRIEDLRKIGQMMDEMPGIHNLIVATNNKASESCSTLSNDRVFEKMCEGLTQINAGGGVIENQDGKLLLIFRNGRWDLPKGKQEPGEDIATTALREVEEETGIAPSRDIEPLCLTHHCYHLNGQFIIKHTHWYRMSYSGNSIPVPQTEEGIEKAVWVEKQELPSYLKGTFPLIAEVLSALPWCYTLSLNGAD